MDSWDCIMADMLAEIENGDTEIAHGNADDILVRALRYSALSSVSKENVERLIARYEKVSKWYA